MIKHILTILWNQRRQNGWMFVELLLVFLALWMISDSFVSHIYTYNRPLGYNVENCWRLSFGNYPKTAPEYVSDTALQISDGEALIQILDRMNRMPEVEATCAAFYSSPYSFGNSWTSVMPLSSDSTHIKGNNYHRYVVSAGYFKVFRVKDKSGVLLYDRVDKALKNTGEELRLVTPEMESDFFGSASAVGKYITSPGSVKKYKIFAVVNSIRPNDFEKPEAAVLELMSEKDVEEYTSYYAPNEMEITVRMKKQMTQGEMNAFLAAQGEQLSVCNLYVNGASFWKDQRDNILAGNFQEMAVFLLIAIFTLLNVFFGITGTFWLRVEQKRSETGLRMALGSTRRNIGWLFTAEGWLLLCITLPLVLIILFNFCYMELPDTKQMDMSWWRFFIDLIFAFSLMAIMTVVGTWIPARKAMKLQPAEALHYE